MKDVAGYLSGKVDSASNQELGDMWSEVQQLHQKGRWHQLTQVLLKLVERPELQNGNDLYELYTNVISDFEIKLNPLSLVIICSPIVDHFEDKEEAVQFILMMGEKVKAHTEAFLLTRVMLGEVYLTHYNNKEKVKQLIEEIEGLLDDVEGVGDVHAKYYSMAAKLYQQDANHAEYYRASLRYLGCTDISAMSAETKASQGFHLGVAALLGKDIFNFGELLAHPILQSLSDTPNEWIVDLLTAFNAGDVTKFETARKNWQKIPDLAAKETVLYEKICLLALMEMTFQRGANNRLLTFKSISQQANLPDDRVELLVMKALAKGLVKGSIDQVGQTVNLTWVQPRVLGKKQVRTLMDKLVNLNACIQSMENMIEDHASDILTV